MLHLRNLRDRGFTLIELLVVILIIGILAAIALPNLLGQSDRGHNIAAVSELTNLRKQLKSDWIERRTYTGPASENLATSLYRDEPAYELVTYPSLATRTQASVERVNDDEAVLCLVSGSGRTYCIATYEKSGISVTTGSRPAGGGLLATAQAAGRVQTCWAYSDDANSETALRSELRNATECPQSRLKAPTGNAPAGGGATAPPTTPAAGSYSGPYVQSRIATDNNANCFVTLAGETRCWGHPYYGYYYGYLPVPSDLETANEVSLGANQVCITKRDTGGVRCWGEQWRQEDVNQNLVPSSLPATAQMQSNGFGACTIVKSTSKLRCWPNSTPTELQDLVVKQVARYSGTICVRSVTDEAICSGQAGFNVPSTVGPVNYIAISGNAACAIRKSDEKPVCWGPNTDYAAAISQVPADIGPVKQVYPGITAACAVLKEDSSLRCWGSNSGGELDTPPNARFKEITSGGYHFCGIQLSERVACWGSLNASNPPEEIQPLPAGEPPVIVNDPTPQPVVSQVQTGEDNVCVVKTDDKVTCWGKDDLGQSSPPSSLGSVTSLGTSTAHSCAVQTSGALKCWGRPGPAINPPAGNNYKVVSSGVNHSCAIKTDDTVACWGLNSFGITSVPAGLGTVKQISAGNTHTCAVKTDDTVSCWGNKATTGSPLYLAVPGDLGEVKQVASGGGHTCAVKPNGTVRCWGQDTYNYGVLNVPAGLDDAVGISAGVFNTCVVRSNNQVRCWGNNYYGQNSQPGSVLYYDTKQVSVSPTGGFICALRTDNAVRCWGSRAYSG